MGRQAVRWQHRSDERESVGGSGDVTISESEPLEVDPRTKDFRVPRADAVTHGVETHAKGLQLFALYHRQPVAWWSEKSPVLRCVQLASESNAPAVGASERWKHRRSTF